ncbi:hypothetical protein COLO4_19800 [Corchorus olitorius]|uniref:Uncharacterized protein n=1 Tax=Corchorus olitorius TaxID=93759 RepID=A0A1R3J3C8_9ROSI|nr:hypothetical protein COLO4_19800 [Corchorus olitorius]
MAKPREHPFVECPIESNGGATSFLESKAVGLDKAYLMIN